MQAILNEDARRLAAPTSQQIANHFACLARD
jgi:hypothetical protein